MKEDVAPVSSARVSAGTLTALGLSSLDVVEEASNPEKKVPSSTYSSIKS